MEINTRRLKSKNGKIVLIETDPNNHRDMTIEILEKTTKDKNRCIYVSLNRPCESLNELFKNSSINKNSILTIDCTTSETKTKSNCINISSPRKLTDMAIVLEETIKKLKSENSFLVFDSISTLSTYQEDKTLIHFFHFLVNKIKENKINAIFITPKNEEDENVISNISQLCDEILG